MKYKIIYADPPWHWHNYNNATASRWVGNKYQTMSKQELQKLPIQDIADENSVLFIWITFPTLPEGLELIEKWGFTYKTNAFTWIKKNKKSNTNFWGMGYYTRSNAEICVLATRGKTLPRLSHNIHSIIESPVETHSKKPDIVRSKIVDLFGDLPRLEMFARQKTEGWDVFGNEVEDSIII